MTPEELSAEIQTRSAFVAPLRQEIARVLIGQTHLVDRMLVCLLTGNHLLVEGLPGLAKTLAVNTLAQTLSARFGRIQFTPDLLPADVIGTHIYNPGTQEFTAKEGPVFTNLLLADEINRAPAKVQSALLEAMQESQVTLGGETRDLPDPFLVMATQNPLDQEGTYPLPEAQMDRFMMKVIVGYPGRDEEREVLRRMSSTTSMPSASPVTNLEAISSARSLINEIHVDPKIEDYILDIVFATREEGRSQLSERQNGLDLSTFDPLITAGASPRATIQLIRGSRCLAFLEGRAHVLPEDVKAIAPDILGIEIRSRRIVQNRTAGAWHASFKGRGIEFAEIREYQEGDEMRSIDWNVSARLGSPYIKLFTEEREQNVFFLVDRSASGQFGSGVTTKAEYSAEVAAVLAFSATLNKDKVGLLLYSDQEELQLDPARGHRHVLRMIRELLAFEPKSPKTDLSGGIEHLLKNTLKRSIVFILSDLITPDFEKPLRSLIPLNGNFLISPPSPSAILKPEKSLA